MQTLKIGSKGSDVILLQQKLGIKADGIFGAQTEASVKKYQSEHGCTPDGIVGPHTWEALGIQSGAGRVIDEIIIHCSATKEGKEVSSDSIGRSHKARKFSSYVAGGKTRYIGYHYLVHLDGRVEECRPNAKMGCHASGHNARSIGICYIGGLDARDINGTMIKDTRTTEQKGALIKLIKELKRKYPTIKRVIGHRDTSPDLNGNGVIEPFEFIKGCPCFDASVEYKNL
ncbi:MAG: N-acetylmuramoyl-L-alanine amidase [Muribaculaceae bacterium]|nr:N-acetylmuramoyl-L-alanine amidase [Muribaculaceae bacterium]